MKKLLFLLFSLCAANLIFASHLRCGYITVTRSSCDSRDVLVTITVFTNTASAVMFGNDGILSFGDGSTRVVPEEGNTHRPDLGPNIGMVSVTIAHQYAAPGEYLVSYVEPNRNGGVLNMQNSFFTTFYIETKFSFSGTCNSSPKFLAAPIFSGSTDSQLQFSLGASSPNDKLITYEMATPFRDRGIPVEGYVQPSNMALNELTGLLNWNTESAEAGEYNFAVVAVQWIKADGQYKKAGFVRIDFQVILHPDGPGMSQLYDDQELDEYSRILVEPGEEKTIELTYESAGVGNVSMEMFSELSDESVEFDFEEVADQPGKFKGMLKVTPQNEDSREHAHLITVRARTGSSVSDRNYLIYTDGILEYPVVFDPVTEIEKDIARINVFPNPFQQQLNIEVNRAGQSQVFIFTALGVLVSAKTFELKTDLMLTDISPGTYICDVSRNGISVKKIKLIKPY